MTVRRFFCAAAAAAIMTAASVSPAAAQGEGGIKFGPTFADFDSDNLDFDNRTGLHGGLFFGGNRRGVLGVQTELNWIRKRSETSLADIRIDYVQVPVLLRLNIGSPRAFAVYGIAGPALNVKVADEVNGFTIDDDFEGIDVGLVFGGGIEISRLILEGRYERGLRAINDAFNSATEIKTQTFTALVGIRFN
jgi:hypothetical protein